MEHQEGQFQGMDGIQLYYQCWRPDANRAKAVIVMLHGDFAHSGWYLNLPNHVVNSGYSVYAYDRRGWGRSPGRRGYMDSWREYIDDLAAFLQLVRKEEQDLPLFLMGHTGSTPIVLEYAMEKPQDVCGVFCISPVLGPPPAMSSGMLAAARILSRVFPKLTIDLRRNFDEGAVYVSHDQQFVDLIRTDPLGNTRVTPRWLVEEFDAMQRIDEQAPSFPVPLFFLIAGSDRNSPVELSRSYFDRVKLSDKQLNVYPGAYTNLLSDTDTEQVITDIERWLDDHLPPPVKPSYTA